METRQDPEILSAPAEAAVPRSGEPADELSGEVILERNGIHYINNRMFFPDKDTEKTLDHKFVNLVESVIKPDAFPKSG
jgi:hypothetical protein